MKIAFDVQPTINKEKTGVGYVAENLVKYIALNHSEVDYQYNCFHNRHVGKLYRLLSSILPIPYCLFFPGEPDVTHFFNFVVPPLVKGKRIVTIHDMSICRYPETVQSRTKWMLRLNLSKTLKRADCVITVSEFSKNEIMNYFEYPEHRIRVVYNGIDLKRYRPDITPEDISRVCETYNLPNEYILYLGTLEPRKNIERLIEAYAIAKQGHSLPTLVLAGRKGWLYDGIFAKYKESGMSDGIVFTDYIAEENKPAILAGAKFFVFPSLYEGFGLPPLEAMACGTPAIVSSAGSLPEVCGDAAVYVEPFEVNCIAGALLQVNSDDELRARIREKGLARARLFDWNRLAEQLFEIYKEVMAS